MSGIAPKSEGIAAELRDIVTYGLFALYAIDRLGKMPEEEDYTEEEGYTEEQYKEKIVKWAYSYFGITEHKEQ